MDHVINLRNALSDANQKALRRDFSQVDLEPIVRKLRAQIGRGLSASEPVDRIQNALKAYFDERKLEELQQARYAAFGAHLPVSTTGQSVLDDPAVLSVFLGAERGIEQWKKKPAWYRRVLQGLVISYFTFDPHALTVSKEKRQGWETLRKYLHENIDYACEPNNPEWLQCCVDHKSMFTEKPGQDFAEQLLSGNRDDFNNVLELLRAKESWFPREMVLGQIQHVVENYSDAKFQPIVDQLLDMLEEHKKNTTMVDDGLCLIINRYASMKEPVVHNRLKEAIVHRWDNPWLQGSLKKWHPDATKPAKDLVAEWLTGEFIEAFFTKLSEEANSDSRRMNFWMTYRKQMSHVRFAIGANFLNSYDPDVVFLRNKMRGLYTKIRNNSRSNAFIMFMGDLIAVEFSSVSNALYLYSSSSGMPFNLDQELWDAVNVGNTLKNQRLGERHSHQDRIKGYERWEQRIADILFTEFGVPNDTWRPTKYATSKKIIETSGGGAGLYSSTGGLSMDKTSSVQDEGIPVFNKRLPTASAIEKVLVGRTAWVDLLTKPYSLELLKETANAFAFTIEDNKAVGGAIWVRVDNANQTRSRVLRHWGFTYKANKGWWR